MKMCYTIKKENLFDENVKTKNEKSILKFNNVLLFLSKSIIYFIN